MVLPGHKVRAGHKTVQGWNRRQSFLWEDNLILRVIVMDVVTDYQGLD